MMRRLLALAVFVCLLTTLPSFARERAYGYCTQGGLRAYVNNSGTANPAPSFTPTYWMQSYPSCTVTVYLTGTTTLATIYSDNASTPLANPFTASSNGYWRFYADAGRYDVRNSNGGLTTPFTIADIQICDTAAETCSLGGGGGTGTHNLLSATHPDTVPYSPPQPGDLIIGGLPSADLWQKLSGNTANSTLCLQETGNGSAVTAVGWGSCGGGGGSSLGFEHNGTNVASEPNVNFSDSGTGTSGYTPVVFGVADNGANSRADVTASVLIPPTSLPPPLPAPFPVPAGSAIAWAFPTACSSGSSDPGATNGSASCGIPYGTVMMTQSSPLGNWIWGDLWTGFTMPALPPDATITGIYGVFIANQTQGAYPPAIIPNGQLACGSTTLTPLSVSMGGQLATSGGTVDATTVEFTGEFYTISLGTSTSVVTSGSCAMRLFQTLSSGGFLTTTSAKAVAMAIYYTTATAPSSSAVNVAANPIVDLPTQSIGILPIKNGGTNQSAISFGAVADGSPITWTVGSSIFNNGVVALNHTVSSRFLNVSGMINGGRYNLKLVQDSTGGAVVVLGTGCQWIVNNGPTTTTSLGISTAPSNVSDISWIYDGTYCHVDTMSGGGGSSDLAYLGTWNSATNYAIDNIVTYNGSSWIAVAANNNVTPGSDAGADWAVFASAGSNGVNGTNGINGTNGADGAPGTPGYSPNQTLSGCGVAYSSGLTFNVSACSYIIQGVTYGSAATTATPGAADPSFDRIDAIVVNTSGAVVVVPGTAAGTPAPPSIDIATQLQLTFVYIAAGATTPSNIVTTDLYHENTEWTCASSANVNCASTSNPRSGTKDIEWTNSATNNFARLTIPSSTIDLSTRNNLVFWIRSKAAWASTRSVTLQWFNGSTAKCSPVLLANGNFGFSSSLTSAYQQIVVPTSLFACNGIPVTRLQFTQTGSGAALGFYLDDIILQGGIPAAVSGAGLTPKGTWVSSTTYAPNDVVFSGGGSWYALLANTNSVPTTSNTNWQSLGAVAPFISTSANPAATGMGRFANGDRWNWRNAGNTADCGIGFDSNNNFTIDPCGSSGSEWQFVTESTGSATTPPSGSATAFVDTSTGLICTKSSGGVVTCGGSGSATIDLSQFGAIADDSTDNATAVTNFNTAVNAYAGSGLAVASCSQPSGGKAYKSSVGFSFTHPTLLTGGCTFDYSGTGNAVTLGPTLGSFPTDQQAYKVSDITFIGGASAAAGILIKPYISTVSIYKNTFLNFGSSSNYAIDANGGPLNEAHIEGNIYWVNDATTGRNFMRFNDSSGLGSVSPWIVNNLFGNASAPSSFNSPCGGVGLFLGAPHAKVIGNSFFGFGANIQLANTVASDWGDSISYNAMDSGGCTLGGLNSNIQIGSSGGSAVVDGIQISGNDICRGTLFDKTAAASSASLTNSLIFGNTVTTGTAPTSGCTSTMTAFSGTHTGSSIFGNTGFTSVPSWDTPQGLGSSTGLVFTFITSALASDTFTRANASTLGANWTNVNQDGTFIKNPVAISSNAAIPGGGGANGGSAEYYSAVSFPSSQYSQALMSTLGVNAVGALVNVQAGATTYYEFSVSTTDLYLLKMVAGTQTIVTHVSGASSCAAGQYASLVSVVNTGNTSLTGYCNGVQVITGTDSSSPLSGGKPGVYLFGAASGNGSLTNWSGGGTLTDSAGSGAPAGACVTGSTYRNTAGGTNTTFYVCEAAAWAAK